jgi:hypothetical protein
MTMPKTPPLAEFRTHPMRRAWLYAMHAPDDIADPYRVRVTLRRKADARGIFHIWAERDFRRTLADLAKAIDHFEEEMRIARRPKPADARQSALL